MSTVSILGALNLASALGGSAYTARELGRTRPILRNSKRALGRLSDALDKRVDELRPGATLNYKLAFNPGEGFNAARNDQLKYASSTSPDQAPGIKINPNADRIYLAHEMGHLASQQTDIGRFVAALRANPKLSTALTGALLTAPGIAAAVQPGDEDMDESLALATLASLPTLVDEGLATKNGLAIADAAGLRASMGQRGKLAGAFLSYLAPAAIAGISGNVVGNLVDQDI